MTSTTSRAGNRITRISHWGAPGIAIQAWLCDIVSGLSLFETWLLAEWLNFERGDPQLIAVLIGHPQASAPGD